MIRTVATTTATIPITILRPPSAVLSAREGVARTIPRATIRTPHQRYFEVILWAISLRPSGDSEPANQLVARPLAFRKPPFSDAAGGEDTRISTCTDNNGVDFVAICRHDEVCDHRWPVIFEVDGEGTGAIGVHRVSAAGYRVSPIGDDLTVNGYGVNLTKTALTAALRLTMQEEYKLAELRFRCSTPMQDLCSDNLSSGT